MQQKESRRQGRSSDPTLIYILHSGNLYGTERMALATLGGLNEYRERVVFAPLPYGRGSVAVAAQEAGFVNVTFRSKPELAKALFTWFSRNRRIDMISTGVSQSLLCYVLAKLMRVRLRQLHVTHGGTEEADSYGRKHHLNRIPLRMIAVSDFVRDKLVRHGVKDDIISVIDNFLPDSQRAALESRLPYDAATGDGQPMAAQTKVAVVSRIDPIKRIDLLVDAASGGRLDDFSFDVYGTGYELDLMRRRAESLPNIRFHGFVDDVQARLTAADVLLHLCPEEPFGLAVLEAFQAKLVCVVPDAGGAGNLVIDGKTGFRFRANDEADLVRVLHEVRAAPAASLQRIADAGHASLDERFSEREGARRYREAFTLASPGRR